MAHMWPDVIVRDAQYRVISTRAIGLGNVGAIAGERIVDRNVESANSPQRIDRARGFEGELHPSVLGASAGKVHHVGSDVWINSAEGCLLLAQNRAWKWSAKRIRRVETMAGEIGDAGSGHRRQIAIYSTL